MIPAENSVTVPVGVIRPILFPSLSANQRLPSGPATIRNGRLPGVMPAENSVIVTARAGLATASAGPAVATSVTIKTALLRRTANEQRSS